MLRLDIQIFSVCQKCQWCAIWIRKEFYLRYIFALNLRALRKIVGDIYFDIFWKDFMVNVNSESKYDAYVKLHYIFIFKKILTEYHL